MISRASRGPLSEWWWTVDRISFFLILGLMAIGLMLAVAASPTVYGGPMSAGTFVFAFKQVAFAGLAIAILIGISSLQPSQIGSLAIVVFGIGLLGSLAVLFLGTEVHGARRWLDFGPLALQPSEFIKPGFAVLTAGLLTSPLTQNYSRPAVSLAVLLPAVLVLVLQPDIGQTFLLVALWAALLFFAGLSTKWIWVIGAVTAALVGIAYLVFDHVHHRIQQFLDPSEAGYQAGLSLRAFAHGGFFGTGPGAGTVKYRLPEAHSDYIFAVAGEEFGFILCAIIAALFCVLAVRLMLRSATAREPFVQLAGAGLAMVMALQAFINMGVAVSLLPSKGMTLPFISYGGSSLFAISITKGFALGLTRNRPQLMLQEKTTNWEGAKA
ncbi:MAG: putative peptidoglycan glycosyltransferase FtsW [Rhizomicrobium sp.]